MNKELEEASENLWKKQSEENWNDFRDILKDSEACYYKIISEKGKISKEQDLRKSYAELFDEKERMICKIPIFMNKGKKVAGATIYLVGLQILNSGE